MKLVSEKFGIGTVVSQDTENVTIDFDGTVKTLIIKYAGLKNEDGSAFGVAFVAPVKKAKKTNPSRLVSPTSTTNQILWINDCQNDRASSSYSLVANVLNKIENKAVAEGNGFISDVIKSIDKYMRASQKQAEILGNFYDKK